MERGRRTFTGVLQGSLGVGSVLLWGFCALVVLGIPLLIVSWASEQFYTWGIWPIGAVLRVFECFLGIGFIAGLVVWVVAIVMGVVSVIRAAVATSTDGREEDGSV